MNGLKLTGITKRAYLCTLGWVSLCAVITQPSIAAPVAVIHITGAVAKPADWTNAQLSGGAAGPVVTVPYKLDGVSHTAHCVSLLDVIQAAQPSFNPHIKHHNLQFVVAVQGLDGYTVDFSLAELLPAFGNHPVWLQLDEDGKPLSDESGPEELIVPDDVKPGRWVHGISTITIIDGAKT